MFPLIDGLNGGLILLGDLLEVKLTFGELSLDFFSKQVAFWWGFIKYIN